jgi:hypothetical protein
MMIKITDVLKRTVELYDVTEEDIRAKRKDSEMQIPRLVFVNIAKMYGWTHAEIAKTINRSIGDVTHYLGPKMKQKNTVLYRRGYNSMINKMHQDERDG